jgi:hypothetical protein
MVTRQPRLQENYDWIVLGDTPAALLSAALVARMGLSVLIVAEDAGKKWAVSDSGQLVDLEPNFLMGLARMERLGGVVAECLNRLRFAPSEWQRLEKVEIPFQVVTPHIRANYCVNNEGLERELKREAGGESLLWLALTDALAATELMTHGFWRYLPERFTLMDPKNQAFPMEIPLTEEVLHKRVQALVQKSSPEVKRWFEDGSDFSQAFARESDQEWLAGWIAGAIGKEWQGCSPYHALELLSMARTGVRIQGGVSSLRQALLRLAIRLGAQWVSPEADSRRIFVEGGKILGLQLGGKGSVIRTKGIAAGRCSSVLKSWVNGEAPTPIEPYEGLRVTLAISVYRRGIPEGMASRCVWKEAGAPALEIERASPEHYGLPGSDYDVVFLRSVFAAESASWEPETWRNVLARMFRQACEVMPFLEENEFRRFPDFKARDFSDQWVRFYGVGARQSRRELMRVPLRRQRKEERWNVEGLFLLDGTSQPQWGSLGEFADSLEATAWIAHRSGLAGPLG